MQTIRSREKAGKDGTLSLRIPVGLPDAECDVVVVVNPNSGWPSGYFEATFGSIDDDSFVRMPQGELPPAPKID